MAGQGGHTRGILIEFWQHLPSVITPSMAMTEGERRRGLIPWFPSQFVFPAQNTDHTGSINTELRAAREREQRILVGGICDHSRARITRPVAAGACCQ